MPIARESTRTSRESCFPSSRDIAVSRPIWGGWTMKDQCRMRAAQRLWHRTGPALLHCGAGAIVAESQSWKSQLRHRFALAWWPTSRCGLQGWPASLTSLPRKPQPQLVPVTGSISELLANDCSPLSGCRSALVASSGLKTLETIRRLRPDIRLIVIGPEGDDELVLQCHHCRGQGLPGPERGSGNGSQGHRSGHRGLHLGAAPLALQAHRPSAQNLGLKAWPCPSRKLTARERQVLELILMARSNREIATQLGIEERTVRAHLGRLMRKAGVDNRIKLSMSAPQSIHVPARHRQPRRWTPEDRPMRSD